MQFVKLTFAAGSRVSFKCLINPNHLTFFNTTCIAEEHLSRKAKDIYAAMQQAIKNATPVAAGFGLTFSFHCTFAANKYLE